MEDEVSTVLLCTVLYSLEPLHPQQEGHTHGGRGQHCTVVYCTMYSLGPLHPQQEGHTHGG
jgi:hypothetical protein